MDASTHYLEPLQAFVRHRTRLEAEAPWDDCLRAALASGQDLRPFKRARVMPRVAAAIGVVRALGPTTLLDIGSGRGGFVWPALEALRTPSLVTVERSRRALELLGSVRAGGLRRLQPVEADASALGFGAGAFDVVTILEVLEHVREPEAVVHELLRVTRRAAVATVPARADENPEHLRLFTAAGLRSLFLGAGFRSARVDEGDGFLRVVASR